jgi:hypothetical protein
MISSINVDKGDRIAGAGNRLIEPGVEDTGGKALSSAESSRNRPANHLFERA